MKETAMVREENMVKVKMCAREMRLHEFLEGS